MPLQTTITILAAILLCLYPSSQSSAATEAELKARMEAQQKEIQKLEEEIAAYQKTLSKTSEQSKTLQQEVARVETQIKKVTAEMRLTQNKIASTQLHIEELGKDIQANEEKMESHRQTLAETLQTLYQSDTSSLMEIFLQHKQISDFFGSLANLESLEKSIHANLATLYELKQVLEDERDTRTEQKKSLSALDQELQSRRAIEQNTKKTKNALLAETKNEEARYQQLLRSKEAKRTEMLNEIQRTEDELRKLINPSAIPESRKGLLAWPIKGSIPLTQSFGNTPDSKILYNGKPHNGIDLGVPVGTPLYAADSGTVWETGNTDAYTGCLSYGKWILIKHTNNLATLYAHLSQITAVRGASVARGDLIGYTGETGYATGPHLHFTVYDASTVQFRASKIAGSNCQFLPYGGYLNPLAYL